MNRYETIKNMSADEMAGFISGIYKTVDNGYAIFTCKLNNTWEHVQADPDSVKKWLSEDIKERKEEKCEKDYLQRY